MKIKVKNVYMLIDDEDYPKLNGRKIFLVGGYCKLSVGGKLKSVHRIIIDCPEQLQVDHKNRIKHDNRKSNLRVCSPSQNGANRKTNSGVRYKGVTYKGSKLENRDKKWESRICVNGKRIFLGMFKTIQEAAKAYDTASIKHFGEFSRTNF
jgi:hypothetical protein